MQTKTVAILESRLGRQLGDLVGKHEGQPFYAPALAEIADVDSGYVARLVGELESRPAKFAIFQTGVGTQALFRATDDLGLTARLLALLERMTGRSTRSEADRGVALARRAHVSAAQPFTTAQVLEALQGPRRSRAQE